MGFYLYFGYTPLHWCAQNCFFESLVALIEQGNANVNIPQENEWGYTAIHWAAQKGHKNIVEYLINKNVDIHQTTKIPTFFIKNS